MKSVALRYLVLVLLFLFIGLFPWWVVIILCGISAFIFDNFFEIIAIGLLYDIRFHAPGMHWYLAGLHTVILLVIFIVSMVIHKLTRKPDMFTL